MDSYFSKKGIRKIVLTLVFYLIAFVSFSLLNKASPSGPCTPGLGIMSLLLLPFISAVLFIINIIKAAKGNKTNTISAIIHLLVVVGFFIILAINK